MDLFKLPPEVILKILSFLNGNDFKNSRRVCKVWNDFIGKWILENPSSRHPCKINLNWMNMKPSYKETELPCTEREKYTYNLLAAHDGIFAIKLEDDTCGIFEKDQIIHKHRIAHAQNGWRGAIISDKLIMISYNGTDQNELWNRWDILERLKNGEVCVRATNQYFGAHHELKCDGEYFVIQENDVEAEEEVKMLSLYRFENEKIRKVFTENLAVNFKLLQFNYPYIVLKKMRKADNKEYQLTVMKADDLDKIIHHKTIQYKKAGSVAFCVVSDVVYVKDHFFVLEHGSLFQESDNNDWLRVINADTGKDVSDGIVPTDSPIATTAREELTRNNYWVLF